MSGEESEIPRGKPGAEWVGFPEVWKKSYKGVKKL
jgi:hypothetical protein